MLAKKSKHRFLFLTKFNMCMKLINPFIKLIDHFDSFFVICFLLSNIFPKFWRKKVLKRQNANGLDKKFHVNFVRPIVGSFKLLFQFP